jgi:5-oxoprolinase (ATP-hydrolysing)
MNSQSHRWKIWADTGGTFTDVLALDPQASNRHQLIRLKILSSSALRARVRSIQGSVLSLDFNSWLPEKLPLNFWTGCRFRKASGKEALTFPIRSSSADSVTLTTDHCANFQPGDLVELRSPDAPPVLAARLLTATPHKDPLPPIDFRIATTLATNALLEGKTPPVTLFTTPGLQQLLHIHTQQRDNLFSLSPRRRTLLPDHVFEVPCRVDAHGHTLQPLRLSREKQSEWAEHARTHRHAAVCLIHSARFPDMETQLAEDLRKLGYETVSVSSGLWPFMNMLERAETSVVNASLKPVMDDYLSRIRDSGRGHEIGIMTSSGSIQDEEHFEAKDSLISGPAGGVVGVGWVAAMTGRRRAIGLDIGGTSTDVCRLEGAPGLQFEHRVGPARIVGPSVRIETVAAGGGSICGYRDGALHVGPESAGSRPGPACYGFGGPLTLTDINLLLGRMRPEEFGIPVDPKCSRLALKPVIEAIEADRGYPEDEEALLLGFLEIANENMAAAIRTISVREGYDPADYTLVAFGGAGGLHGCDVADKLGIREVLCPEDAGILSARGLQKAPEQSIHAEQLRLRLDTPGAGTLLRNRLSDLEKKALDELEARRVDGAHIARRIADMRLHGQAASELVDFTDSAELLELFLDRYRRVYGYTPSDPVLEVVTLRVIGSGSGGDPDQEVFPEAGGSGSDDITDLPATDWFLPREAMKAGVTLRGSGIIQDHFATIRVPAEWAAVKGSRGTIRIQRAATDADLPEKARRMRVEARDRDRHPDTDKKQGFNPVEMEIFSSRFSGIAGQMGEALKRTALSTNVKERMDFSCAVLDRDGYLVANAPHIPVHLGAMGYAVRRVLERITLEPGDAVVCNHPAWGGSHLPDITVIQGVYDSDGDLVGYVANRAHHAEVGGIRPGSMPPAAASLEEEGVVFEPMYFLRKGESCHDAIRRVFLESRWPTRRIEENMADLMAQVAANQMGSEALKDLADAAGRGKVQQMMERIREHASWLMRSRLEESDELDCRGVQELDDGTRIELHLRVADGRMAIDFTGTSDVHPGNLNATPGIVRSAIMYCLRLWIGQPIPLNDGLLELVDINLPECFLNPPFPEKACDCPAVVGGNTETSQNIVEAFMKATGLMAGSQGTMNNLIFGNERFSFYETLGGGSGAGKDFDGGSAVHSHMTNTAVTDPEILEDRYPVRVLHWGIRNGSGGDGRHKGGEGMTRKLEFLEAVQVNLITHHRTRGPSGMAGGQDGVPGSQFLYRDGCRTRLRHIDHFDAQPGDILEINTPGGGGYGRPS